MQIPRKAKIRFLPILCLGNLLFLQIHFFHTLSGTLLPSVNLSPNLTFSIISVVNMDK